VLEKISRKELEAVLGRDEELEQLGKIMNIDNKKQIGKCAGCPVQKVCRR
jgi:hypothetical protein